MNDEQVSLMRVKHHEDHGLVNSRLRCESIK